jgi:hypothetical protein
MGGTPPGGGPPPTSPNSPSRGTVPEASNERRPGLTYNSPVSSTNGKKSAILSDTEDTIELSHNQELVTNEDESERIVERKPKSSKDKKYSIVDDPDFEPESKDDSVDTND